MCTLHQRVLSCHPFVRLQKLTAEQKCDIATRELDELHEEIERKKEDWEKQLDCHQAVVEEAKQRMDEIKKHHYEFERDVCRGGVDPVSTFTAFPVCCVW